MALTGNALLGDQLTARMSDFCSVFELLFLQIRPVVCEVQQKVWVTSKKSSSEDPKIGSNCSNWLSLNGNIMGLSNNWHISASYTEKMVILTVQTIQESSGM